MRSMHLRLLYWDRSEWSRIAGTSRSDWNEKVGRNVMPYLLLAYSHISPYIHTHIKMYLVLGVYVEDITAGKYKRTMVPYKKPNNADRQIVQEELNRVLTGTTTNYCY